MVLLSDLERHDFFTTDGLHDFKVLEVVGTTTLVKSLENGKTSLMVNNIIIVPVIVWDDNEEEY